jgi:hypothetical protein
LQRPAYATSSRRHGHRRLGALRRLLQCVEFAGFPISYRVGVTMTTSLYLFSVPLFLRHLAILTTLLESAERQAKDRSIDPEALITARLFPDMFPLAKQVRAACDTARRAAARLSGEAGRLARHGQDVRGFVQAYPRYCGAFAKILTRWLCGFRRPKGQIVHRSKCCNDNDAAISHSVCATELLLSRHDRLRHPSTQRFRSW